MITPEQRDWEDVVFTPEQGLAINKHIGEYSHIELLDKELISQWVDDRIDGHFVVTINANTAEDEPYPADDSHRIAYLEGFSDGGGVTVKPNATKDAFEVNKEYRKYRESMTETDYKEKFEGSFENTTENEPCPECNGKGTYLLPTGDYYECECQAPAEDEVVFCPTCKTEVQWVKGWYDCDYCGQLKEHPLMDTATPAEDEPKQKDCYWRHDEKEEGWVTSCSPFIFKQPPAEHCPKCGGFVVIDFYGKHTGLQQEDK